MITLYHRPRTRSSRFLFLLEELEAKFMKVAVPRGTAGWVELEEVMPVILARLAAGAYLLGEQFSAVDRALWHHVRAVRAEPPAAAVTTDRCLRAADPHPAGVRARHGARCGLGK